MVHLCWQTGDIHCSSSGWRSAVLHPAGSAGPLPEETEEDAEEGDHEEDPAGERGLHWALGLMGNGSGDIYQRLVI